MYAMLALGIVMILCSIPLLRRDIKVETRYRIELENSRRELGELNELKYQVIAEVENMINNNTVSISVDDAAKLVEQGYVAEDIARRLNKGVGEIQTVLHLNELRQYKADDQNRRTL